MTSDTTRAREIFELLGEIPKIDIHTHLTADRLMARGLDDVLLYHMVNSELYAATHLEGESPAGARVPEDRDDATAAARIRAVIGSLPQIRGTSMGWLTRRILKDLYDWTEEPTERSWMELDRRIRERNRDDGARGRELLSKLAIRRTGTEIARRADGRADDLFQYALEWAFFARPQWERAGEAGQADMPLFELERAWNAKTPELPVGVTMRRDERPALARVIRSVDDLEEAVRHYVRLIPRDRILATAQHISTDIDYVPVAKRDLARAIRRRESAGPRELGLYASAILGSFLRQLEESAPGLVFQFSLGAEPLPYESAGRLRPETIGHVAKMIAAHPRIRFMCFNASRHGHQSLCTLVRELPNFSLAGYWWHSFFPTAMEDLASERLDMVPLVKQCDYLTDAYCVDWVYGKDLLIRRTYAELFARRMEQGQIDRADVEHIAKWIFFEAPRKLLGFTAQG